MVERKCKILLAMTTPLLLTATLARAGETCAYSSSLTVDQVFEPMSHNTYIEAPSYAAALDKVRVVEIDIWDCDVYPLCTGDNMGQDWYVRHGCVDPTDPDCTGNTNHCGRGDQPFSVCLEDIRKWHDNHPGHPLITIFIDKKEGWGKSGQFRSPCDLDCVILDTFERWRIFTPSDLMQRVGADSPREAARQGGWPSEGELQGKFMFILTGGGVFPPSMRNQTQSAYVADRHASAVLFVAPDADAISDVTGVPDGFDDDTAKWVVGYNLKWEDASGTLGDEIRDQHHLSHIWNMSPESCSNYSTAVNTFEVNFVGLDGYDRIQCSPMTGGYNCGD